MQARLPISAAPGYYSVPNFTGRTDIVVGIPCFTRPVSWDWMRAMVDMRRPQGFDMATIAVQSKTSCKDFAGNLEEIGPARDLIVQKAQEAAAKFLLFVDDDVEPPKHALVDLMAVLRHRPNARVVGGIYCQKNYENIPVVWDMDGDDIGEWSPADAVFKCSAIGAGCMLIDMRIFSELPYPWFSPSKGGNEDKRFCAKVRKLGYDVLADGSIRCGHWAGLRKWVFNMKE
jgi:hypothetical protein